MVDELGRAARKKRNRVAVAAVLLVAAGTLVASPAKALTFTPIKPPTGCTEFPVNFNWGANNPSDVPQNLTNWGNYTNNIDYSLNLVGNGWTYKIGPHFFWFRLASGDTVSIGSLSWSGILGTGYMDWTAPTATSTVVEYGPAMVRFRADATNNDNGVIFDTLRVCSNSKLKSPIITPVPTMSRTNRETGVLLGDNDVVYLYGGDAPVNTHASFALWGDPYNANSPDFDLYARCGALPTPTAYDYVGNSDTAQEMIHWKTQCSAIYLAVVSYRRSGVFHVSRGRHYLGYELSAANNSALRAGSHGVALEAGLVAEENALRTAARRFYGLTEGRHYIEDIWLYNNGDCNNCGGYQCSVCFEGGNGRSFSSIGAGQTTIYLNGRNPQTIAHEWGHLLLGVYDEYTDAPDHSISYAGCGHSGMATSDANINNFCTTFDHAKDYHPQGSASQLQAVWQTGLGLSPETPCTFDNYDYQDHSMSGIGKITRK